MGTNSIGGLTDTLFMDLRRRWKSPRLATAYAGFVKALCQALVFYGAETIPVSHASF